MYLLLGELHNAGMRTKPFVCYIDYKCSFVACLHNILSVTIQSNRIVVGLCLAPNLDVSHVHAAFSKLPDNADGLSWPAHATEALLV